MIIRFEEEIGSFEDEFSTYEVFEAKMIRDLNINCIEQEYAEWLDYKHGDKYAHVMKIVNKSGYWNEAREYLKGILQDAWNELLENHHTVLDPFGFDLYNDGFDEKNLPYVSFKFAENKYTPRVYKFSNVLALADHLSENYMVFEHMFDKTLNENEPEIIVFRNREYTTSELLREMGSSYYDEFNDYIVDTAQWLWEYVVSEKKNGGKALILFGEFEGHCLSVESC